MLATVHFEATDNQGRTVLHWAAKNGDSDTALCLLENSALLEAVTLRKNTVLNVAVLNEQGAVVDLLLKKNANLNARNINGKNALDIAIAAHSRLIKPLLIHLATLPKSEQSACLLNVFGGSFENVYAYVAIRRPALFPSLITSTSRRPYSAIADVLSALSKLHFNEHLERIFTRYQRMKETSFNHSYPLATLAARMLFMTCVNAQITLFQSEEEMDEKMTTFKNTCQRAIAMTKPALEKHQAWGKILSIFLHALRTSTPPTSQSRYSIGLFSVKTKAWQLMDAVDTVMLTRFHG